MGRPLGPGGRFGFVLFGLRALRKVKMVKRKSVKVKNNVEFVSISCEQIQ